MEESDYFERNGADIYTDAEISISQAILGGTLRIEGIYEDQTLDVNIRNSAQTNVVAIKPQMFFDHFQITPGTSSHTRLCLEGKGLKKINSYGGGDHYVTIRIRAPSRLNDEQKKLAIVRLPSTTARYHINRILPFYFFIHTPGIR